MIRHGGLALLALAALGIAGWTYGVNYDTRAALDRISDLRIKIADEREEIQVLRVEWAWLNRPDRLARLVRRYEDKLALIPLTPAAFGYVAAVPYPPGPPKDAPAEVPSALVAQATQAEGAGTDGSGLEVAFLDRSRPAGARREGVAALPLSLPQSLPTTQAGEGVSPGASLGAAGGDGAPSSMDEAVTLALIEAGVLQPAGPITTEPGTTRSGTAEAAAGVPVPPARPALQIRQ